MSRMEPASFACPHHEGVDLTPQVEEQLEELGTPVAYDRSRLFKRHRAFEIVATCPGGGTPHPQVCIGKFWT
jgi:hypothetical protein